jgi:uncharacterized protein YsxB (DUF464 family)
MIKAQFLIENEAYKGFIISGHDESEVCAAVTSAVMLTINAITEHFSEDYKLKVKPGRAGLLLTGDKPQKSASLLIRSLSQHLALTAENGGDIIVVTEIR